jgi:hypothetical protein
MEKVRLLGEKVNELDAARANEIVNKWVDFFVLNKT